MPVITILFKEKKISDFPLAIGQGCTIGRKSTNDIVIDNIAVSGSHAQIDAVASTFVLRDLDSTNGTFVNKKRVSMHNLRHMDKILIGKHTLLFNLADTQPRDTLGETLEDADKTRILDTSEYRDLLQGEKDGTINHPARQYPPPQQESREAPEPSLFKRLLKKIFG